MAFNDVWCDPKPGYDRVFNLVGKCIRCCFPKLVRSSSFHVPEASTQFLEGEIVSIVKDESQTLDSTLSYRQSEGRGTTVDLLIAKECFKSMPFLSRFRIDSDIDVSQLTESSRRYQLNELRIKGSDKAIVRVVLSGTKQQTRDDCLVVRWVLRKRICIKNLKPQDTKNEGATSVDGTTATSSQKAKKRKITNSRQLFIGDGYDSELQQRTNWRWFASQFNPMSFARTFRIPFDFVGCAISQVVGEVIRIEPEPPNSTSLAMVTVRRLVLPEHTLGGRLSHQRDIEVFQDFDDSKSVGNNTQPSPEEKRETGSALFNVPIEEILVISKKISHHAAVHHNEMIRGLVLTDSYSLRQNKFFNSTRDAAEQSRSQAVNPDAQNRTEKIPAGMSERDCFRCYHGFPFSYRQKLVHHAVRAATSHRAQSCASERSRISTFWGTQDLLQQISTLDFSVNNDFISLASSIASPRPNLEKRKSFRTKSKRKSSGINDRFPDSSTTFKTTRPAKSQNFLPHQHLHSVGSKGNDVPPRTCSRMSPFNQETQMSEARRISFEASYQGEKLRNSRLISMRSLKRKNQCHSHKSNRAIRASQRRLLRNVLSIGLNIDTLAGRDYEEHLRFDRSKIHAWGVFADKEIKENQMIVEYRGEIIGNSVAEKREVEYNRTNLGSDYMFRIDALTVCDATKYGNVARFLNHSCDPNCFTKIICIEGIRRIVVYAKRNIDSGEELCYDYKFPLEDNFKKRIECHCSARACRGYMN